MAVSKKKRQAVFDKFRGRCGYTGVELDNSWQVDHITPECYYRWHIAKGDPNDISNLIPTLKILNHYKRGKSLEEWRDYLLTLHSRLKKLPKKTQVDRTMKRKQYLLTVAGHFGITGEKPFGGKFYFETWTPDEDLNPDDED